MRIWRLSDPSDERFASAGMRGSWSQPDVDGTCSACGSSRQVRVQPLILAWEPGSDHIGDFLWPGFDSEVVVTESVLTALRDAEVKGFEPGTVEMIQDPELSPGPNQSVVELPYRGPALHELWVTRFVTLDRERSSAELERRCAVCGTEFWELYGVERWESSFDFDTKMLVRTKVSRLPRSGVFVGESQLEGSDIFRVREFPAWVFCTDRVRELIEKREFSNVSFLEMGDTV